jgi:hypothetical protein
MQTEAVQVHVFRSGGGLETGQDVPDDVPVFGIDAPVLAARINRFSALLLKPRIIAYCNAVMCRLSHSGYGASSPSCPMRHRRMGTPACAASRLQALRGRNGLS